MPCRRHAGRLRLGHGPRTPCCPAVVRDLFRKTGRPLEREVDLVQLDFVREHRFADGTSLGLAAGRSAQLDAVEALGRGLGKPWVDHVAAYADDWDVIRRGYLEAPWDPDHLPRRPRGPARLARVAARRLRRASRDERLRLVAAHPFVIDGHDLRNVPVWTGVTSTSSRGSARGPCPGAPATVGGGRVAGRHPRVTVLLRPRGTSWCATAGWRRHPTAGELDAEVVVCAIDPRRLPALARYVRRTMPAIPPAVSTSGSTATCPTCRTRWCCTATRCSWCAPAAARPTAARLDHPGPGRLAEDVLRALARHRIDIREQVVARVDRPRATSSSGGAAHRWACCGRAATGAPARARTPIPGVYAAGAHATPGSGLPFVGLSAALVAQAIGPADRTDQGRP